MFLMTYNPNFVFPNFNAKLMRFIDKLLTITKNIIK